MRSEGRGIILNEILLIVFFLGLLTVLSAEKHWIREFSPELLRGRARTALSPPLLSRPLFLKSGWSPRPKLPLIQYMENKGYLKPQPDAAPHWYWTYHSSTNVIGGARRFGKLFFYSSATATVVRQAEATPELAKEVFKDVAYFIRNADSSEDLDRAAALLWNGVLYESAEKYKEDMKSMRRKMYPGSAGTDTDKKKGKR